MKPRDCPGDLELAFIRGQKCTIGLSGEFDLAGLLVLIALLVLAFAAGYFTRDYISRQHRERARIWRNYIVEEPLTAANTNTEFRANRPNGDLGQMLQRWDSRARARRSR
jgi:hypothetical protein